MNNKLDRSHDSEFKILNQLMAAQAMFHRFTDEGKLLEFIIQTFIEIPAIKGCFICTRNNSYEKNMAAKDFAIIAENLQNTPDDQDHFSIKFSKKENSHTFSIQTIKRSFGYVFIDTKESSDFEIFKAAISNFINMIALEMENRWQRQQLIKHKLYTDEQVEKRTEELKAEITECKQTEGDIKASEENFRTLVANIPGVTYRCNYDKDWTMRFLSKQIKELSGYPATDFILNKVRSFTSIIHIDDREKVENIIFSAIENKESFQIEYRINHANGEIRWIYENGQAVIDEDNAVSYLDGVLVDISERKQVEEKLQKSEQNLQTWIQYSPVCTKIVDLNYNLQFMSASGVRELNIDDITEYYGKPYPLHFYPDSFKIPMRENLKKAKQTGNVITQEAPIVDVNGNELWYHSTIVPVNDNNGKLDYIMVVSLEVTESKLAEKAISTERNKLTSILESMQDGVYIVNQEYDIQYINSVLKKDFGDSAGIKCYKYFHGINEPCTFCKNKEVFAGKTVQWEWTSPINGKTYDLIDTPIRNSDGSLSKLEIFRDITYRKKADDELQESLKREQNLADIVRNNPVAIAFGYPDGRLEECNQAFSDLTGYSLEELQKINWSSVLTPPKWKEIEAKELADLSPENNYIRYEKEYIHKDGTILPVELLVTAKYGGDGNIIHFIGFITDISERIKADKELANHRNYLEELVKERTLEVDEKNKRLSDQMKVFVGREQKINDLEKRIRLMGGKIK